MSQILDGISMMHRNAFVHGDLNPNVSWAASLSMSIETPVFLC